MPKLRSRPRINHEKTPKKPPLPPHTSFDSHFIQKKTIFLKKASRQTFGYAHEASHRIFFIITPRKSSDPARILRNIDCHVKWKKKHPIFTPLLSLFLLFFDQLCKKNFSTIDFGKLFCLL